MMSRLRPLSINWTQLDRLNPVCVFVAVKEDLIETKLEAKPGLLSNPDNMSRLLLLDESNFKGLQEGREYVQI